MTGRTAFVSARVFATWSIRRTKELVGHHFAKAYHNSI
jgi:hypothetical protein